LLTFAASQNFGKMGSLLPFAAFSNKANVKSEGERRLCGTKLPLSQSYPMAGFGGSRLYYTPKSEVIAFKH